MSNSTKLGKRIANHMRIACVAMMLLKVNGAHAQQAAPTPPARTYHVDQYGRETKVVKERWGEDGNGEKHGKYIAYMPNGEVKENTMYNHGVKNGPSFIFDKLLFLNGYLKFVGTYTDGRMTGIWSIYDGDGKTLKSKEWYDAEGKKTQDAKYKNGKLTIIRSYRNKGSNSPNGPARVYGGTGAEYASGSMIEGEYVGTWMNATMGEGGKQLIYQKGGKIVFERGKVTQVIDPQGTETSYEAFVNKQKQVKELVDAKAELVDTKAAKATMDAKFPAFYPMTARELVRFNDKEFATTKGNMTGSQLTESGILKTTELHSLILENADPESTKLILKAAQRELGGKSPLLMLISNGTFVIDAAMAVANIKSPTVDAEMFYAGLRGVGAKKRMLNSSVPLIIKLRSNTSEDYLLALKEQFAAFVKLDPKFGPLTTASNPLRQWLYEEYVSKEPYKWMNFVTLSDDEDQNRPESIPEPSPKE